MHSDLVLEYKHFEDLESTNDFLRTYSTSADIAVVSASYQTKGRGQMGNTWVSQHGANLLFSVLLRPQDLKAADAFILSQAMALSIKSVLDPLLADVAVKWPNDIYCRGKKICGTLIENGLMGKGVATSIIGSGINVNQTAFPDNLAAPATSLAIELQAKFSPHQFLHPIVERFSSYYSYIQQGRYQDIREEYMSSLYLRGQQTCFQDNEGTFLGVISHVEPDGHIVILDESSALRRYAFKQVKFLQASTEQNNKE